MRMFRRIINMLIMSGGVGKTTECIHSILGDAIRPPKFTAEERRGRGTDELSAQPKLQPSDSRPWLILSRMNNASRCTCMLSGGITQKNQRQDTYHFVNEANLGSSERNGLKL